MQPQIVSVEGAQEITFQNILFAWSGGKDSALALYELQQTKRHRVIGLLTTVAEGYRRTSMHGVRESLLDVQAQALGLPLEKVFIPDDCSHQVYEQRMEAALKNYRSVPSLAVCFGDIFLDDLRKYREDKLAGAGLKAVFPLWKENTAHLAQRFLDLGFKAIVTCVDTQALDASFSGSLYDKEFLGRLPAGVDPCGENGEFHTFVYDGPVFKKKINFTKGEIVLRENRFSFCDLVPQAAQRIRTR